MKLVEITDIAKDKGFKVFDEAELCVRLPREKRVRIRGLVMTQCPRIESGPSLRIEFEDKIEPCDGFFLYTHAIHVCNCQHTCFTSTLQKQ